VRPCDPHHTDKIHGGGVGLKGSDTRAVPLCAVHHAELHLTGRDTFAQKYRLDMNEEIIRLLEKYIAEERWTTR
jgi:hypothetical protein